VISCGHGRQALQSRAQRQVPAGAAIARLALCAVLALPATLEAAGADTPAPKDSPPGSSGAVPAAEASIPFADHGGIYNWEVIDDRTMLLQDRDKRWYKATVLFSCQGLTSKQRVGFVANPDGSFDKMSALQVGDQRCPLKSLTRTGPPQRKPEAKSKDT
jgi:hypothetical protein